MRRINFEEIPNLRLKQVVFNIFVLINEIIPTLAFSIEK